MAQGYDRKKNKQPPQKKTKKLSYIQDSAIKIENTTVARCM